MSAGSLFGRPIVFNARTAIPLPEFPLFYEEIAPTAFANIFSEGRHRDVPLLRDHEWSRLLARVSAGTLELAQSPLGIEMRAELPDTELGRETMELVRRGDLNGMSFGFFGVRDEWFEGEDDVPIRVIQEVRRLLDVSVVTMPAYPQTRVSTGKLGRSGAPLGVLRKHAALTLHRSLETRGRQIEPSTRLKMWIRQHRRRVTCVAPIELR